MWRPFAQADWEASWQRPFAPGWAAVVDSTGGTRGRLADGGVYVPCHVPPRPEHKEGDDRNDDASCAGSSSRSSRSSSDSGGRLGRTQKKTAAVAEETDTERKGRLAQAQALRAGGGWFRAVTHVVHARQRADLDLDRVVAWLSSGLGLQGKASLRQEGVWDLPLHATPEFRQALAGAACNRGS
jgi:hypothetical protein